MYQEMMEKYWKSFAVHFVDKDSGKDRTDFWRLSLEYHQYT